MAHQVQKMAYVGEIPWHGLGQELTADAGIDVWKREAGFEWDAQPQPMYADINGEMKKVPGKRALVRSDNNEVLSVVSKGYKVVQPRQILNTFNDLILASGLFTMETAGCLKGGRKIWALAKAKEDAVLDFGGGEKIQRYALLATSFDKSLPTLLQQTSIRVVCNNTLTAAFYAGESGGEKRIAFSHMETFNTDTLRQRMVLNQQWSDFAHAIGACIKVKLTTLGIKEFFKQTLYPAHVQDGEGVSVATVNRNVDRLLDVYQGAPGQELETAKGTLWGAVNAVTFHVDHVARARTQDARLDKAWFGQGATVKNRAMELAMAISN